MTVRLSILVDAVGPTLDDGGRRRAHVSLSGGRRVVSLDPSTARALRGIAAGDQVPEPDDGAVRALLRAGLVDTVDGVGADACAGDGPAPMMVRDQPSRRGHLLDPERVLPRRLRPPGPALRCSAVGLAVVALAAGHAASWPRLRPGLDDVAGSWVAGASAVLLVLVGALVHELAHAAALVAAGGRCRSVGFTTRPAPGLYADTRTIVLVADPGLRAWVFAAGLVASAGWAAALMLLSVLLQGHEGWSAALVLAGWLTALLLALNIAPWRGSDMQRLLQHLRIRAVHTTAEPLQPTGGRGLGRRRERGDHAP